MADSSGKARVMTPAQDVAAILGRIPVSASAPPASASRGTIVSHSPIDGAPIGNVTSSGIDGVVAATSTTFCPAVACGSSTSPSPTIACSGDCVASSL